MTNAWVIVESTPSLLQKHVDYYHNIHNSRPIGGVLQFPTAVGEAQSQVGGPAAVGEMLAGNAKIEAYIARIGNRAKLRTAFFDLA